MGSCFSMKSKAAAIKNGGAGKLNEEVTDVGEIKEDDLRGIFDEFDLNGDGYIQRNELKSVMIKMGQSPTEDELNAMFNAADRDEDGNIDFHEFLTIARANPLSLSLKAVFEELDADGDGHITRSELRTAFQRMGHTLSDQEIKAIYKHVDINKDGKINFHDSIFMDSKAAETHPLNLNSPQFNHEAFVSNLLQKKSLDELLAVEEDMVQNVRRLDSEMQQLVYENYNKFLTATNTVRNMQAAFTDMDNEMHGLSIHMKEITVLSDSLTDMFENNRRTVQKLTEKRKTVERLQYFATLPEILQGLINEKKFVKAVKIFVNVQPKLERYKNFESISGIYSECKVLMAQLEEQFNNCLNAKAFFPDSVLEAAQLLMQMGRPEPDVKNQLLTNWQRLLDAEISNLESNLQVNASFVFADILEFVDNGCCTFLTNLSLYILLFVELFKKSEDKDNVMEFIEKFMKKLENVLIGRFQLEKNSRDCALFVRALDRISRKIAVFSQILPGMNLLRMNAAIVVNATEHQISICRDNIKTSVFSGLEDAVEELKTSTTTANFLLNINHDAVDALPKTVQLEAEKLNEKVLSIVSKLDQSFLVLVKTCLANLLLFNANDINLNSINPKYFGDGGTFCINVFENIVAGAITDLSELAKKAIGSFGFIKNHELKDDSVEPIFTNPKFFLAFGAFLHNLKTKQVEYLIDLSQEQFKLIEIKEKKNQTPPLTTLDAILKLLKSSTESLLRNFVQAEYRTLNLLVVNSIEWFNWSECSAPPTSMRVLVKRLLLYIQELNSSIITVVGETTNVKKELTSSVYKSLSTRQSATSGSINTYETTSISDSSLGASGIMEKLWSDEPDDSSTISMFDKTGSTTETAVSFDVNTIVSELTITFCCDSIISAIICVCLKRMTECIMELDKPFTEFGLQQIQVDCAYLKQNLWQLSIDEHALNILIDDCVTAAVLRCAAPKLLEPTVVRAICEQTKKY